MRQVIGIDFGTTFSSIAFLNIGSPHQPIPLQFVGARHHTPTMLRLDPNDRSVLAWGWEAQKNLRKGDGCAVLRDFKRSLGETDEANELTRLYLGALAAEIRDQRGRLSELHADDFLTSIGVPANWTNEQAGLLKSIAESVGFPEVRVVQEPIPAMHNLRCQTERNFKFGDRPETFMVVDFGGGTLDICVVKTQELGREPQVLAVDGDPRLGGIDFDDLLEKWFAREIGISLDTLSPFERASLREQVQDAKEDMSGVFRKPEGTQVFQRTFHLESGAHTFAPTKQAFENRCRAAGYFDKIADAVKRAMKTCGLQSKDVKRVILTGGSSKWFFVRQIIAKEMGLGDPDELLETDSPYTDVACGLAIRWGRTDEPQNKPGVWLEYKLGRKAKVDRKTLLAPGRVQTVEEDRLYLGEIFGSRIFFSYELELAWFRGPTDQKSVSCGRSVVKVHLRTNRPRLERLSNMMEALRGRDNKSRPDSYKLYMITREDEFDTLDYSIEVQDSRGNLQTLKVRPGEEVGKRYFGLGKVVRHDHTATPEVSAPKPRKKAKTK